MTAPAVFSNATRRNLRIRASTLLGITVVLHLLLDLVYRPWAAQQKIVDFGLADSFTQVTSVVGIAAIMVVVEVEWFWREQWNEALLTWTPALAMIGYEVLQGWLPWGTFDPADIAWTLGGAVLAYALKARIYDPLMRRPYPTRA